MWYEHIFCIRCGTNVYVGSTKKTLVQKTSLHLQRASPFSWNRNMRLLSLTNGGTILISRGWIGVSKSSKKSSQSLTISLSLFIELQRMNQLRRLHTFEIRGTCEYFSYIHVSFLEWVLFSFDSHCYTDVCLRQ